LALLHDISDDDLYVYNKNTVGNSCEQGWFNIFVDIQAQQDAATQDKDVHAVDDLHLSQLLSFP
jgi:hypothetical protein